MAEPKLCPKAEKYIKENKVKINQNSWQKLSNYESSEQVKWVTNPFVQFTIESYTNQILERLRQGRVNNPNTGGAIAKPQHPPTPVIENSSSDNDDPIFPSIFDEDDY